MDLESFPFPRVAEWLEAGKLIPFLGAGASMAGVPAGEAPPNGSQLARELIDLMQPGYIGKPDDPLTKVAQIYEHIRFDRPDLYSYLHKRFYTENRAQRAAVPRMLATVPTGSAPLYIVTTNYDSQVELAFKDAGRPLCVISQNVYDSRHAGKMVMVHRPGQEPEEEPAQEFLPNVPPNPSGTAFLYKMHGSAHRQPRDQRDSLVVTEDDYVDFLVHAGGSAAYVPPPNLTATFKSSRFLFLGYSLEDWNLRAFVRLLALRHALAGGSGLRHFAVQLQPDSVERHLWAQRRVELFEADLVDFCDRLEARWQSRGP